jgi:hypothetical protein
MKKIAVFHFNPIELYPPAMNFLDCLQQSLSENDRVWVYTTRRTPDAELYHPKGNQIVIKRIARYTLGLNPANRLVQYLRYYLLSFLQCIRFKPSKVFYYETISSFTPYLLKRWPGTTVDLFIHYHEYMTRDEYSRMILNKTFHRLERQIYRRAKWLSHSNKYRMQLFLKDLGGPALTNTHIFPNYPPAAWASPAKNKIPLPVRFVYVGAMDSLELLYIRETFDWIRSRSGEVQLDIYSFKVADEIKDFFTKTGYEHINWKGSVAYKDLPQVLKLYDIGLILYKGPSANVIFSASNKLFEYLVCGLDVWYPKELTGSHEYDSLEYWPKVLPLDFLKLEQYILEELVERKSEYRRNVSYSCEEACSELVTIINS